MKDSTCICVVTALLFAQTHGIAQEQSNPQQTDTPQTVAPPANSPPSPAGAPPPHPTKAPKPKSRLTLIKQMQVDLDAAAPRARVDDKDRKKLDKCHDVLLDAAAQQQRYKSVNVPKVNGCLKDIDKLLDTGAFAGADRDKLQQDSDKLGESVGKTHRIKLPQPL